VFTVFRGGRQIAADSAELPGPGESTQAAGHLLPQLDGLVKHQSRSAVHDVLAALREEIAAEAPPVRSRCERE
jgi:hypothetical protein